MSMNINDPGKTQKCPKCLCVRPNIFNECPICITIPKLQEEIKELKGMSRVKGDDY